jgi:hypothetical protein
MANRDNPNGFQFLSIGRPYPPRIRTFIKLAAVATAIFQNDVVHEVDGASGSGEAAAVEPFGTGTPGTTIPLGVALNYGPTLTKTRHHVIVDKDAEYVAQDDGDTDGLALTDMGKRTNVSTGAGSTLTGYSGHEIDEATVHASAARDLLLLRLYPDPLNAFGSSHARVIVKFRSVSEAPLA